MREIEDIGLVRVRPEERERLARVRLLYPDTQYYRVRVHNQEGLGGNEPVTGCLNGQEILIPREQDFIIPEGWLETLLLAENEVVTMPRRSVDGVEQAELTVTRQRRFHMTIFGRFDLDALEKELADEAEEAEIEAEELKLKKAEEAERRRLAKEAKKAGGA